MAKLWKQADATATAMQALLVNPDTGLFRDGLLGAEDHSAWHAQTNALWHGVAPNSTKSKMLAFLSQKGMVGSVYAAYSVFMALYADVNDHGAVGLDFLTRCDDNSYCHMLNVNATATMEAWTRKEKPNLSWSHPWASASKKERWHFSDGYFS